MTEKAHPKAGDGVFLCGHMRAWRPTDQPFYVVENLPDQMIAPGDRSDYQFQLLCSDCADKRKVDPACPIVGETIVWPKGMRLLWESP